MLIVVTLLSAAVAAVMSGVAWRVARGEQRRRDARVDALAADIHADIRLRPSRYDTDDEMFAASAAPASRSTSFLTMAAAGILVVSAGVALAVVMSARVRTMPVAPIAAAMASAATHAADAPPLELAVLSHERDGDRLMVRGVVRNPTGGPRLERLTAIVVVFDADGRLLATSRMPIDAPALPPGGASSFVVAVPNAGGVSRYRVGFRIDDHVVPHVDTRGPGAQRP